jgi:hypothetical protein
MMGGNSSSFVFHWRRTNICILADVYDAVMFLVTHFKSKNIKSTTRRSTAHFIFLSTITVHIIIRYIFEYHTVHIIPVQRTSIVF